MNPAAFDIEAGRAEWSSFMPALLAVLKATTGAVLEVGVGHYSTPFLHDYCLANRRELVSAEEDMDWALPFRNQYARRGHTFYIGEYDAMIASFTRDTPWSVILLDHSPGPRRGADMVRLLDAVEFIVIHDYHLAIEEAVKPHLAGLNHHAVPSVPPTLVVSKQRAMPPGVSSL